MENSVKMTYKDLISKFNALSRIDTVIHKDKLTYYVGKLMEKMTRYIKKYNNLETDIYIEHCSVDKEGNVMKGANDNLIFSKDGMKKRNAAIEKLSEQEIEVDLSGCICLENTRVLKLPIGIINELNGVLFNVSEEDLIPVSTAKTAAQN